METRSTNLNFLYQSFSLGLIIILLILFILTYLNRGGLRFSAFAIAAALKKFSICPTCLQTMVIRLVTLSCLQKRQTVSDCYCTNLTYADAFGCYRRLLLLLWTTTRTCLHRRTNKIESVLKPKFNTNAKQYEYGSSSVDLI